MFTRSMYQCERCGNPATEIAHAIGEPKRGPLMIQRLWRDMYGYDIPLSFARAIRNDPRHLYASCRGCNDYYNVGNNPGKVREILGEHGNEHLR